MLGSIINLNQPAHFLHWHFIYLSPANLAVVIVMVAVFALAIVLPLPGAKGAQRLPGPQPPPPPPTAPDSGSLPPTWTGHLRELAVRSLPPERLLPDTQPAYVASWIYVFGVLSLSALGVVVASGVVLALKGPSWWHETGIGHFFNSVHLWAVELFFFVMVIHLWGKFFMAAWRGGRARTWMSGVAIFLVAIGAAFTGYLSQQNFDSQWISTQAKDAMNSVGIGAFFNVTNFGQMYSYHVLLLPAAVIAIVIAHVLLVRRHGVVPPLPRDGGVK
jgi:hypothetical protein